MENIFTLRGTLYSKDCRKVKNVKKPTEPDWEFYSIKVETKVLISGRTLTQIVELHLDKGLSYDGFEVGDQIEVDFFLQGKAISSSWYKTECKACYIKFAPVEGAKVKRQPKADCFEAPTTPIPSRPEENNNFDGMDLPF
jgi:hypothetical protein